MFDAEPLSANKQQTSALGNTVPCATALPSTSGGWAGWWIGVWLVLIIGLTSAMGGFYAGRTDIPWKTAVTAISVIGQLANAAEQLPDPVDAVVALIANEAPAAGPPAAVTGESSTDQESSTNQVSSTNNESSTSQESSTGRLSTQMTTARIGELLERGGVALRQLRLTVPPEDSAFENYSKVLAIDSDHVLAHRGLERIIELYIDMASTAAARGDLNTAALYLTRALFVLPGSVAVQKLQKDIDHRRRINYSLRNESEAANPV